VLLTAQSPLLNLLAVSRSSWNRFLRRGVPDARSAIGPGPSSTYRPVAPQSSVRWISLGLLLLLAGFVVLLWRVGLFDFQKKVSDAKVFAAVLGLVGGLFATAMTFVAALLKHSVDVRTLGQTRETEARLRLETSIRAVELLTDQGKKATEARQAGALFVLSSLDQLDFSLALLTELWPAGDVTTTAAVWVINRALTSGDEQLQVDAASLLSKHGKLLTATARCFEWPTCLTLKWTNDIHVLARESLLEALVKTTASRSLEEWEDTCVNALVVQFNCIRENDDALHNKNGAALCMNVLLDSPLYAGQDVDLLLPSGPLSVIRLRADVAAAVDAIRGGEVSDYILAAVEALRPSWTGEGERKDVEVTLPDLATGVAAVDPRDSNG